MVRDLYPLSSKLTSIDGPCAWSEHRQTGAHCSQQEMSLRLARGRQGNPEFHDGQQPSRYRRQPTREQKPPGRDRQPLQHCRLNVIAQSRSPAENERNPHGDAEQQKAGSRPPAREG